MNKLLSRYKEKLAAGGKASGRFIPKPVHLRTKKNLNDILSVNDSLCKKVKMF
jgi:hypothetical protein